MKLTHFGHACVLVESGDARLLFDPGVFAAGYEELDVDAILVTHAHFDHFDAAPVAKLLERNPEATLWVEKSVDVGDSIPEGRVRRVGPGEQLQVKGVEIRTTGGTHAQIHADIDLIGNVGFFLPADGFLHPGDDFIVLDEKVRVLATPISGPWQKLADFVDYVREVNPEIAVPIHEGVLGKPQIYIDYLVKLKPEDTRVVAPTRGDSITL